MLWCLPKFNCNKSQQLVTATRILAWSGDQMLSGAENIILSYEILTCIILLQGKIFSLNIILIAGFETFHNDIHPCTAPKQLPFSRPTFSLFFWTKTCSFLNDFTKNFCQRSKKLKCRTLFGKNETNTTTCK